MNGKLDTASNNARPSGRGEPSEPLAATNKVEKVGEPRRLARARLAIEQGDAFLVGSMGDALWMAPPDELAPLLEEALARADYDVLSVLLDVLSFDKIQAALPDFLLLAALVDSTLDLPFVLDLLVRRGALPFRPRPRTAANKLYGPAAAAIAGATASMADRQAGEILAADQVATLAERQALEAALCSMQARALIDFGDCLLSASVELGPEGATLLAIDDALVGENARQAARDIDAVLADELRLGDALDDLSVGRDDDLADTRDVLGAELASLEAALARRSPSKRLSRAQRAALSKRLARAFDGRRRGEGKARAQRVDAATQAQRQSVLTMARPRTGAELRRLARAVQSDTLARRLGDGLGMHFAGAPLLLAPSTPIAALATQMGVPPTLLAMPAAWVSALGTSAATKAAFSPATAGALAINANLGQGLTPLHVAAMAGNLEAVRELLDNGADPQAVDARGRRPLEAARDAQADGALIEMLDEAQSASLVNDLVGRMGATMNEAEREARTERSGHGSVAERWSRDARGAGRGKAAHDAERSDPVATEPSFDSSFEPEDAASESLASKASLGPRMH
ncbi:ankyrin repeat domain-containing protein [Burkholderia vietnamiensis]|uniref:Ankyrin n=1 Tax=Burkholderia vietnamiensis (strain G4 / LMG 22486) TaxID=269482 RepID=A4JFJ6_BURVG|nr:Ankyrin [Burkholderia vietnamiensis G4]MCB4344809.1 ankyrin repeat domain-containing protein [Burkholderia vietnamiensis]